MGTFLWDSNGTTFNIIYIKRNVNVETERKSLKRTTEVSVDEMYAVSVSNDSKLVLAKFKK